MPNILITNPTLGLNGFLPDTLLDDRAAATGTQNVLFDKGLIKTRGGFSKLNLTTTGLNSGELVDCIFPYQEIDGYNHLLAKTSSKIYENNFSTSSWDDKTQSGKDFKSNVMNPVSYVIMAHSSGITLNDTGGGTPAYYHLIVCDGGNSDIQRWAGQFETDFADLLGGGDYHDGSTHRAIQVGNFQSRLILIGDREYDSASHQWVENRQRVRWPIISNIQTWTGTGSGFADLLDTGGINVWSGGLGQSYYIYQTNSIWDLKYVGGTTVFLPIPVIRNIGLLGPHFFQEYNNAHYFVGSDYNVYIYYGGSVKQTIGDQIQDMLKEDMSHDFGYRGWMTFSKNYDMLWIFIVPQDSVYITKTYCYNLKNGSWSIQDFADKFSATSGITAVNLVGSQTYEYGETYQQALDQIGLYDLSDAGDSTLRYGELLLDSSRALTKDYSGGTWSAGGYDYSKAAGGFNAEITNNDILAVYDGSNATNVRYGVQFYTIHDVSATGFSVYPSWDATCEHGIADNSTNVPADMSIVDGTIMGFFNPSGQTYAQSIKQVLTEENLAIGDSNGFVYQFGDNILTDDTVEILSYHYTKVFDLGEPDKQKRWNGISVTAKGTGVKIGYKIDDGIWNDFHIADLSDTFKNYKYFITQTGKTMQARFHNKNNYYSDYYLQLDGTNDYINTGWEFEGQPDTDTSINEIAVNIWFRKSDLDNTRVLFGAADVGVVRLFQLLLDGGGCWYLDIQDLDGKLLSTTSDQGEFPSLNEWHMITVVLRKISDTQASSYLYQDGELLRSVENQEFNLSELFQYFFDDGIKLYLGQCNNNTGTYWKGDIDNLIIFDNALSPKKIKNLYNNGRGIKYTGLSAEGGVAVIVYNMDEGTGTTITDAVYGTVQGTLVDGVTWVAGGEPLHACDTFQIKEFQLINPVIQNDR